MEGLKVECTCRCYCLVSGDLPHHSLEMEGSAAGGGAGGGSSSSGGGGGKGKSGGKSVTIVTSSPSSPPPPFSPTTATAADAKPPKSSLARARSAASAKVRSARKATIKVDAGKAKVKVSGTQFLLNMMGCPLSTTAVNILARILIRTRYTLMPSLTWSLGKLVFCSYSDFSASREPQSGEKGQREIYFLFVFLPPSKCRLIEEKRKT